MRNYQAVEKVSQAIIADGLCQAILLTGSMGRGEEDAYSDVDMCVVVKKENFDCFLHKRQAYIEAYLPTIMVQEVNFVAPQLAAVYEDGLHFDLYSVTAEKLPLSGAVKVIYDPENLCKDWEDGKEAIAKHIAPENLISLFEDTLYYIVEANSAYCRKNYPWAARILSNALSNCSILLRWLYDREHAGWGLKQIHRILPSEQYQWLLVASEHLNCPGFQTAGNYILKMLEFVAERIEPDVKVHLNLRFLDWVRQSLGTRLFY